MLNSLLVRGLGALIVCIGGLLAGNCLAVQDASAQPTHVSLSASPGGADYALAGLVVAGLLIFILRPRRKQAVTAEPPRKK